MTPPPPGREKPPLQRAAPPARLDSGSSHQKSLPLRFRYYFVMRLQKVFPLTVEAPDRTTPEALAVGALTVRPIIPGALVVPAEQTLDLTKPNSKADFQVTPLARGRLRGASVRVSQQGKPLGEVHLGMKGASQRLTWFLAVMTLLFPWWLVHVTQTNPLQGTIPTPVPVAANEQVAEKAVQPDGVPAPAPPGGQGIPERPPLPGNSEKIVAMKVRPGEYLDYSIKKTVWEHAPSVPYVIERPKTTVKGETPDAVSWTTKCLGEGYDYLCDNAANFHLGFYSAVCLLGLTVISWLTHKNMRRKLRRSVVLLAPQRRETGHQGISRTGLASDATVPLAEPID
jgi:hypothetical protein